MSLIARVREGFWSYVSPRKTQERREKPFKAPAPPSTRPTGKGATGKSTTAHARRSMSPGSRVQQWQAESSSNISRLRGDGVAFEPLTPASLRMNSRSLSPAQYPSAIFEDDTLIEVEEIYDANEETIVVTDDQLNDSYVDTEAERKRWDQKGQAQREEGWSEHSIEIFRKIGMRGYEPLLPAAWKLDFPTLPAELFSGDDDEVFIKSVHDKDFRATRALQKLLLLGAQIRDARDNRMTTRGPQDAARRGVETFMKWAQLDGNVDGGDNIDILHVETGSKKISPTALHEKMVRQMEDTATLFREALRFDHNNTAADNQSENGFNAVSIEPPSEVEYVTELPTLYGVIASHTIVALVAYNVAAPQPSLQIIAVLDYGDVHYEVWNSLALALLCVHSRNKMMELKPFLVKPDSNNSSSDSDPDA